MKNALTLLLFVAISISLRAQSIILTPTVLASTGGFASGNFGCISYTVGEMTMVETFSANGTILTQGFQQPDSNCITSLLDLAQEEFGSFVIYPNPAVDKLWFGYQFTETGKVQVTISNSIGQKLADVHHSNYENGKIIQPLEVSQYPAGVYFLTISLVSNNDGKVHSTSKKFQVIN